MKFIRDVRDEPEPPKAPVYVKTRIFWVLLLSQSAVHVLFGNVPGAIASVVIIGAAGTPAMVLWDRRRARADRVRLEAPWPKADFGRSSPAVDQ